MPLGSKKMTFPARRLPPDWLLDSMEPPDGKVTTETLRARWSFAGQAPAGNSRVMLSEPDIETDDDVVLEGAGNSCWVSTVRDTPPYPMLGGGVVVGGETEGSVSESTYPGAHVT
eukprot:CAMPEP_0173460802 /NCGR_PEP_ID=MMETSP1357-20121228/63770_1 /TAXON_ID=77926 /ORGANISM="Hemiselmis rufescens, Strain PCC563" /LENGTH=114 /DNA_ID=CAMNT_0014428391 /DNA_START=75 /DNA_END=419 /DNA_ORIENTATION=+